MNPETRFARTPDGAYLAYQVTGAGPVDIVLLRAWYSMIEHEWDEPVLARVMRRLGAMGRLLRFDRRGIGLSDRPAFRRPPTVEERLDDIIAVMDAAESRRAVLVGLAAGGTLCAVFAATHPDRTAGLVLFESALPAREPGDTGPSAEELEASSRSVRERWATRALAEEYVTEGAPSRAGDERLVDWLLDDFRLAGTADEAAAMAMLSAATDIRAALPAIHVPTLVAAREGSLARQARELAGQIDGARLAILPGDDHMLLSGDPDAFLRELGAFLGTIEPPRPERERVLATVLFTDLVGSTERAVELGDAAWAELLDAHQQAVRQRLAEHRGREVDTAGDGFFATFDGPGRAIRCGLDVVDDARRLGIEVRAGVHAGEVERVGDRIRGVAVHLGARVAALAGPSEVLVSGTVRDLVAGSGLAFADRGVHELKGIPEPVRVWAATGPEGGPPASPSGADGDTRSGASPQ